MPKDQMGVWGRLRLEPVRHPLGEQFNPRLLPRTFSSWRRRRHYGAADSTNAIVDGASVLFDVIVTCEVEGLAHALNVSLRKERSNVVLKACRFRHLRLTNIGLYGRRGFVRESKLPFC